MAHIIAAERIRSDLINRLSGSTAERFERACAGCELPDPVVAALIGVTVVEMWEIRTGGPIPPAALPRINAFLEGLP